MVKPARFPVGGRPFLAQHLPEDLSWERETHLEGAVVLHISFWFFFSAFYSLSGLPENKIKEIMDIEKAGMISVIVVWQKRFRCVARTTPKTASPSRS